MIIRRLLVGLAAGAGLVLLSSSAHASCALPAPMRDAIADSSATFVGTVTGVENYRRWATVEVIEVWKGEVPDNEVVVKGGPRDPAGGAHVVTTVDRSYRVGETYLFVVHDQNGSVLRDNICSRTTVFRADLERFRPGSVTASPTPAQTPVDLEPDDRGGVGIVLLGGLAALVSLGLVLWFVRSRASGRG